MRTDRWNKKWELNLYSFYDHTGLERHLEKMAANGWALESVGTYFLRYRCCKPKKLRFAVVYYPESDDFSPNAPNSENLTFWDYCAQAGWRIVTQRGDTHIFCSEDLDAVPIETEAVVQVETMERAKKGYVRNNTITVAVLLPMQLYLWVSQLRHDPVGFLADGYNLAMSLMILAVILLFGTELIGYRLWLRKAKRSARELGIFTPTHSSRWLCFLRIAWVWAFLVLMLIDLSSRSGGLRIALFAIGFALVPIGGAMLVGGRIRKKNLPPKKSRVLLALTVAFSALLMVGITFCGILGGWFAEAHEDAEEYTYTIGGSHQIGYVYHDELPLCVQDLMEVDYDRYSCKAVERGSSVFVRQAEYRQTIPYDVRWSDKNDPPMPELSYTVTDVRFAPLFSLCLQSTLCEGARYGGEYRAVDPAPWGADRAWRKGDAVGYDEWVLVYGSRIVELDSYDSNLDEAQMATVGERLGK